MRSSRLSTILVWNVIVFSNDEMFWIQRHEDKKWPSLRRLVEGFVRCGIRIKSIPVLLIGILRDEKGIISKPLLSAFRDKPTQQEKLGIDLVEK